VSKPPIVRDLVILSAVALVLRAIAAALVTWPPYTDAAYYTMVADQLATGNGFTAPVIWSFLEVGSRIPSDPGLPVPSNGHWMPLSSLVAAAAMAVGGPEWRVGQVPMVLLSAGLVPLTYVVGWHVWGSRRIAIGGAILALFAGPLLVMYPLVENFAVFGAAGALGLYASTVAVDHPHPGRWILIASVCVGVATLARVDGALLAAAPATAWTMRLRAWSVSRALGVGAAATAAFIVVLAPWLARNAATFGTPLPSAGGHTLWIRTYNEQFSIGHEVSAATYFAGGLVSPLVDRLWATVELTGRTAVLLGGVFILFFAAGIWLERRRRALRPFLVYLAVLFAAMVLIFTFHAPKGAFYHSAPAWLPFAFPLATAALPRASTAAGKFWPFLRRPQTHRFILVVGLVGAIVLSIAGSASILGQWQRAREQDVAAANFLLDNGHGGDIVMSDDPAALWNAGTIAGVALPFDPYPVVEQVIRAYGVDWVVVARREGEPDPLGLWDGAAAVDAEGNRATFLAASPAFEGPGVRVFEVVLAGE